MVFRYFLGHVIREAAQEKLREARDDLAAAEAQKIPAHCDVLVATALPVESGGLVDKLADVVSLTGDGFTERFGTLGETSIGIVETGTGQKRASAAVSEVIATRQPQWVVSTGFAGGLHEELRRGHFLMADSIAHEASDQTLSVGLTMDKGSLAASPGVHAGRLLTVDRLVRSPQEKRTLGEQHGALACDMESFAIAQACVDRKVKFLSVRIISDEVDEALPPELARLLDQKTTAAQLGAAAAALWNRPSSAKDMWKLKEDALAAGDRLGRFLVGVVKQLPVE